MVAKVVAYPKSFFASRSNYTTSRPSSTSRCTFVPRNPCCAYYTSLAVPPRAPRSLATSNRPHVLQHVIIDCSHRCVSTISWPGQLPESKDRNAGHCEPRAGMQSERSSRFWPATRYARSVSLHRCQLPESSLLYCARAVGLTWQVDGHEPRKVAFVGRIWTRYPP